MRFPKKVPKKLPIIKIQNNKFILAGCEALLRWYSPDLGLVFPDKFISVAEETNLISPIGDWVLYKACSDIKPLIKLYNKTFYVSINLSARQLKSVNIIPKLKKIIEVVKINPSNIQLELTETS